jgi:hypothetical protein
VHVDVDNFEFDILFTKVNDNNQMEVKLNVSHR